MYCKKCGIKITDDALFCYKCGASILENEQTTTETIHIVDNMQITKSGDLGAYTKGTSAFIVLVILFTLIRQFINTTGFNFFILIPIAALILLLMHRKLGFYLLIAGYIVGFFYDIMTLPNEYKLLSFLPFFLPLIIWLGIKKGWKATKT